MADNYEGRFNKIIHDGKTIYISDYSNLKPEESLAFNKNIVHATIFEDINRGPSIKHLLVLAIIKNAKMSSELKEQTAAMLEKLKNKGIKLSTAYVGIEGIQKIIVSALIKNNYAANNVEDAKRWLVSQTA